MEYPGIIKLKGRTVVMLSREGCPFCANSVPIMKQLSREIPNINWYILDLGRDPKKAGWFTGQLEIDGVPTFVVLDGRKIIDVGVGAQTYAQLRKMAMRL